MATSPRDVTLGISVKTAGEEQIAELQASILALAKQGGAAAPEFQALANEIGRLAQQQGALAAFQALSDQLVELTARQDAAALSSEEQAAKLVLASRAADASRANQAQAAQAQAAATQALRATSSELTILRNTYDANGARVDDYKAKVQALVVVKEAEKASVAEARLALTAATKAVTAAVAEEAKIEKAYTRASAEAKKAAAAVREHEQALEQSGTAARDLGVVTDNLATAQARISTAFTEAQREANTLQVMMGRLSDAEAELAADTERAAQAERDLAAAIKEVQTRKTEEETRKLADATRLLAAENEFAAETARRVAAAQREVAEAAEQLKRAQTDEFARKLAIAQGFLTTELELQQVAAQKVIAEERRLADIQLQVAASAQVAAEAAAAAGQRISDAFRVVGVRGAQELQREIAEVRAAMAVLASSSQATGASLRGAFAAGEAKLNNLQRELRELNGTLTLGDRAAKLFSNSLSQIAAGNLVADGVGYLVNKVKEMGREFIEANLRMERLTRTMTVITGSTQGAAEKIEFLRKVANLSGQSIGTLADSFIRFQASASVAGIAASDVDDIFQAVAVSGSKMGMTSERVGLALDALGQIAAKNVLSMEELRQQLGDSLPGAFSIAAKGLQVTTEELVKMVETGQVLAGEFFPAFKRGLEDTFGSSEKQVDGLYQAFQRLSNAFELLYQRAAGSSAFKALEAVLDGLASNLSTVVDVTYGFGKALLALKIFEFARGFGALGIAAKASAVEIGVQTAAVVSNTVSTAANTTAKLANAAATRTQALANGAATAAGSVFVGTVGAMTGSLRLMSTVAKGAFAALGGLPGLLLAVALNARELGTWIGEASAKMVGWGKVLDDNNRKLVEQAAREKELVEEKKRASAETERAIQRETVSLENARKQLEANVKTSEKATATDKDRAALIERIAALYGTEAEQTAAASRAADINAAAAANEAAVRQESVAALDREIAAKKLLIETSTNVSQKVRDEVTALESKVAASREESERSAVAAQSARIEAAERKIVAEAFKDNSEKVKEYRDAMEASRGVVADLTQMEKDGLPVKEALAAAELELAKNTRLYTDALQDKAAKIAATTAAQQADIALENASRSVRMESLRSMEALARANGDEATAIYAKIEQKRIEIEVMKATAQAQVLEQEGIIEIARLKLQEAKDRGTLTEVMKTELETVIKHAQARAIEAKAIEGSVRSKEREIESLRSSTSNIDANTASRYKNVDAINAQAAAEKKTSDGFKTNADGSAAGSFNNALPVDKAFEIVDKARKGSLTADDMATAQQAVTQAQNAKDWLSALPAGSASTSAVTSSEALLRSAKYALEQVQTLVAQKDRQTAAPGSATPGASTPGTSSGGSKTVNITINGRSTPVNVASDADAANLTSVLRQLESAAGTSR